MDALMEYFCSTYGITKIPLLYVNCDDMDLTDGTDAQWDDPLVRMTDQVLCFLPAVHGVDLAHLFDSWQRPAMTRLHQAFSLCKKWLCHIFCLVQPQLVTE